MAGDTDNPRIWIGADVYVADVDTVAPADTTTAWSGSWEPLGLLSEDGMTESRDQDSTDHYAWGGILVRTTRSKHKRTIVVTALEDNDVVFGLVNPGSTAESSGGVTTRTVVVPGSDPRSFGFEFVDGDITKRRIVPRGEVVEVGDVTFSDDEMAAYELTINIYPDGDGVLYYDITDDPQAEPAGS
jgi:hypothetical protein